MNSVVHFFRFGLILNGVVCLLFLDSFWMVWCVYCFGLIVNGVVVFFSFLDSLLRVWCVFSFGLILNGAVFIVFGLILNSVVCLLFLDSFWMVWWIVIFIFSFQTHFERCGVLLFRTHFEQCNVFSPLQTRFLPLFRLIRSSNTDIFSVSLPTYPTLPRHQFYMI